MCLARHPQFDQHSHPWPSASSLKQLGYVEIFWEILVHLKLFTLVVSRTPQRKAYPISRSLWARREAYK
jgi:hypothetical protein